MPILSQRKCSNNDCSNTYTPTGPAAKFCKECSIARAKASALRRSYKHKLKNNLIKKPGVGKGGNNSSGSDDDQYKNGIGYFMKIRGVIRQTRRYCERCGKDLLNASRYEWAVHHRDHDRTNNSDSNFELLCKKCHQIEHDCHKAFEGVETIRKE